MTEPLNFYSTAEKKVMFDTAIALRESINYRKNPEEYQDAHNTVDLIRRSFPRTTTITRSVWDGYFNVHQGTVDLVCHADGSVTWENWVDECD